jgi:HD-GYP domain-containing protein (c-di-GMP phosphodiesterase class II)
MLTSPNIVRPLYYVGASLLLVGSLAATALIARPDEWRPLALVLLLGALALIGQHLQVMIRAQAVNAAFVALVLAMCLLGPGPAVAFGLLAMVYTSAPRKLSFSEWLSNLSTHAAFPLAGGLIVLALVGDVHSPANSHAVRGFSFAAVVLGVYLLTMALNFLLIAGHKRIFWDRSMRDQIQQLFIPLVPAELAAALLTVVAALAYTNLGLGWSLGAVFALLTFQVLISRLIRAENLAEKLQANVFALVSSQVGMIRAAVNTLDRRDPGSERHAAAVAVYARDLAKEAGYSNEEQYFVHTAGLAHDIGRLGFSDRVLRAHELDEDAWLEVRRHPIEGSAWVGQIHGYGPVADIILSHHERWDGSGYPDQLIGPEIPPLSRILAVCEAFDTMTGQQTYRTPITAEEAFEELRSGAGTQFDPELVEAFIQMRSRNGPAQMIVEDADFDAELDVERRVRTIADPDGTLEAVPHERPLARLAKLFAP